MGDEKSKPPQAPGATQASVAQGVLTEARKTVLAQHYAAAPDKPGLVAHFREYGTPEERAFIERISNSRN